MSRRREKRNFLALPVRAFGIDAGGNELRHVVCTLDLSAQGARIIGLPEIQVGQEIVLEHKRNRVRFQAMWVGQPGTARQGQVGLRSLDPQKKLADIDEFLAGDYVDNWSPTLVAPAEAQAERRQVQRYDCDRGAAGHALLCVRRASCDVHRVDHFRGNHVACMVRHAPRMEHAPHRARY